MTLTCNGVFFFTLCAIAAFQNKRSLFNSLQVDFLIFFSVLTKQKKGNQSETIKYAFGKCLVINRAEMNSAGHQLKIN